MSGWPPSPTLMRSLLDMGFEAEPAAQAVRETGGAGLQQAIDWLLEGPSRTAAAPSATLAAGPLEMGSLGRALPGPSSAALASSSGQQMSVETLAQPSFAAFASTMGGVGVSAVLQREERRAAAANE